MTNARALAGAHDDFLTAQLAALPPLPAVEHISDTVIRVMGGNPGKFHLQGTNTYILGTGRERLLIDTAQGFPIWADTLAEVLTSEECTIKAALMTHWHHDHTGGIPDLRRMSPATAMHKNRPDEGQLPIEDGEEFSVEGATLTAVYTPGHAIDHMCFVLREENALFTGDNVLGHGTTVFEDLGTYMNSLQIMKSLGTGRLYPAHGAIVEKGQMKLNEYIRHRARRENQIVQNLIKVRDAERAAGGDGKKGITSMGLVKKIYFDTSDVLHIAAEISTIQVLEKLLRDGRVAIVDADREKRWYLTDKPSL